MQYTREQLEAAIQLIENHPFYKEYYPQVSKWVLHEAHGLKDHGIRVSEEDILLISVSIIQAHERNAMMFDEQKVRVTIRNLFFDYGFI